MSMSTRETKVPHDQLNLRLPEKLHRDFKVEVTKKGKTESEVIREFIAKYLAEASKPVVY